MIKNHRITSLIFDSKSRKYNLYNMQLNMKNKIWQFRKKTFLLAVGISNQLFGKDLTHRSRLAKGLVSSFRILSSWMLPAYRRQARFERQNPDAPWLVPDAIRQIEKFLQPDHVGFEWGCGRSTLWFARRTSHITSIEGRRDWFEEVSRQVTLDELLDNVDLQLEEVTTEYDFMPDEIARYVGAINQIEDESLDFILVDGHFRVPCIEHISNKLRSGGMLIVDNTDVIPESALEDLGFLRRTTYSNGISETTLMFRP